MRYRLIELGTNRVLAEVCSRGDAAILWENYHYNTDLHVRIEHHPVLECDTEEQ